MNEELVSNIKQLSQPKELYYGEWLLDGECLLKNSLYDKKGKNYFKEFLDRYYYLPLSVVFKDDSLTKDFAVSIVSKLVDGKRKMYFSKKVFLSNIITNVDDVIKDDDSYKIFKKAIRVKKDAYRDVYKLGSESKYYRDVYREYRACDTDLTFDKFVMICKKKYTRLLTGYNTVLELLDKPVNVTKLLGCFNTDQFYLYICYAVLINCEKQFEDYGRVDVNIQELDKYRTIVEAKRKESSFYNAVIGLPDGTAVSIDDLFKRYDELSNKMAK